MCKLWCVVAASIIAVSSMAGACELPGLDSRAAALAPPAAGVMKSGFGLRFDQLFNDMRRHEGLDFDAAAGAPVTAVEAGVATLAETRNGDGLSVHIAHGREFETRYTHLSQTKVKPGDCVARGDIVGAVGDTGYSTGPHLHFEVRRDGAAVDPLPFMDKAKLALPDRAWQPAATHEQLFDAVVRTIETAFFDKERLVATDWAGKARAKRDEVIAAPSYREAVRLTGELLGELKTSHTGLYSQDQVEHHILRDVVPVRGGDPQKPPFEGVGMFTHETGGRHFVDGVMEGGSAEKAGIAFGDEIVSVDGGTYSPVAAFAGKAGRTARIAVRRAEGAEADVLEVPVSAIAFGNAFNDATAASARIIERGAVRIGYIHLWALGDQSGFAAALAAIKAGKPLSNGAKRVEATGGRDQPTRISNDQRWPSGEPSAKPVDFLIVDARGKVGGSFGVARSILELLDAPRESYWGEWAAFARSNGPAKVQNPPAAAGPPVATFRGRVGLLIDHHTRSAGEIMAHGFKRSKFGPVLGTRTAAAVTSGATHLMPGGALLYVAISGHTFDGKPLEGAGVTPDYVVARPLPYANGADPVLEAALDLLAKPRGAGP